MSRHIRIYALFLAAFALASCSDSPDVVSPGTPTSAMRSVSGALAFTNGNANTNANPFGDDSAPSNLSDVATFKTPSPGNGAGVASAVIGANGGSLRLGDFEIVVPPGAVTEDTRFTIRTFPENTATRHAFASFSPHRTFAQPITIRVPLNSTESAGETDAHVLWWDGFSWIPFASTVTPDGRLETRTMHFSMYATSCRGFTLAGG